jgi:hypothetical protein
MQRISILLVILFVGCAPQPTSVPPPTSLPSTAAEAQAVLIQFFDLLQAKQYTEADALYGGDYEQLQVFSPDALDHANRQACSA